MSGHSGQLCASDCCAAAPAAPAHGCTRGLTCMILPRGRGCVPSMRARLTAHAEVALVAHAEVALVAHAEVALVAHAEVALVAHAEVALALLHHRRSPV